MDAFDDFWEMFVREHWEQRPGLFRGLFKEPLITPEQAFAGVMSACADWRAGKPAPIRFFIENALVQSHLGKYLPVEDDVAFAAYAKRIAPLLYGQGFGAVFNGFSHYDFPLFVRAGKFLRGLYRRVGVPGDATDLDVFVGNYRHTPFGIHTDTASNFSVIFEGRKKFLLWPGPSLEGRPDLFRSVDFEEVREQAIVLEAQAGDVVYWPSSYWHLAESDGSLSGVLNVALYLGDFTQRFVDAALPANPASTTPSENTLPWDPWPLPASLERALCKAPPELPREAERRRAVLRAWLVRTTSHNLFRSRPPLAVHRPLSPDLTVTGDADSPIVALEHEPSWLIAAHGHVVEVPAVPSIGALVQRLNAGREVSVGALVAEAAGPAKVGNLELEVRHEDVMLLLENLLAMRAIRIVEE